MVNFYTDEKNQTHFDIDYLEAFIAELAKSSANRDLSGLTAQQKSDIANMPFEMAKYLLEVAKMKEELKKVQINQVLTTQIKEVQEKLKELIVEVFTKACTSDMKIEQVIEFKQNFDLDAKDLNNFKGNPQTNPLTAALAGNRSTEEIDMLVAEGCDLHFKDKDGNNFAHIAAKYGVDNEVMQYAIDNGVDINAKNNFGQTPLDVAKINEHVELKDFLIENNAKAAITAEKGEERQEEEEGNYRKMSRRKQVKKPDVSVKKPQVTRQNYNTTEDIFFDDEEDAKEKSATENWLGFKHIPQEEELKTLKYDLTSEFRSYRSEIYEEATKVKVPEAEMREPEIVLISDITQPRIYHDATTARVAEGEFYTKPYQNFNPKQLTAKENIPELDQLLQNLTEEFLDDGDTEEVNDLELNLSDEDLGLLEELDIMLQDHAEEIGEHPDLLLTELEKFIGFTLDNVDMNQLLITAIKSNSSMLATLLINSGADVNYQEGGKTAFELALERGVSNSLLQHMVGRATEKTIEAVTSLALKKGNSETLTMLKTDKMRELSEIKEEGTAFAKTKTEVKVEVRYESIKEKRSEEKTTNTIKKEEFKDEAVDYENHAEKHTSAATLATKSREALSSNTKPSHSAQQPLISTKLIINSRAAAAA